MLCQLYCCSVKMYSPYLSQRSLCCGSDVNRYTRLHTGSLSISELFSLASLSLCPASNQSHMFSRSLTWKVCSVRNTRPTAARRSLWNSEVEEQDWMVVSTSFLKIICPLHHFHWRLFDSCEVFRVCIPLHHLHRRDNRPDKAENHSRPRSSNIHTRFHTSLTSLCDHDYTPLLCRTSRLMTHVPQTLTRNRTYRVKMFL